MGRFERSAMQDGQPFTGLIQGLAMGRDSVAAACALASLSASSKAGLTREIWLFKASLAFSKAPSWIGKPRCAALIIGSTKASVSSRYESCFWMEKALPMVEWLWNLSADFTSQLIAHGFKGVFSNSPLEELHWERMKSLADAAACQSALLGFPQYNGHTVKLA